MIAFLIILTIALGYAGIRSKHDSYLPHGAGVWKTWAFVEGGFIALCVISLALWATGSHWWLLFVLGPLFAFMFWVVFDCASGYLRTGNILHIGTVGFDLRIRNVVQGKLWRYLAFKLFWIGLITLIYFGLINTY